MKFHGFPDSTAAHGIEILRKNITETGKKTSVQQHQTPTEMTPAYPAFLPSTLLPSTAHRCNLLFLSQDDRPDLDSGYEILENPSLIFLYYILEKITLKKRWINSGYQESLKQHDSQTDRAQGESKITSKNWIRKRNCQRTKIGWNRESKLAQVPRKLVSSRDSLADRIWKVKGGFWTKEIECKIVTLRHGVFAWLDFGLLYRLDDQKCLLFDASQWEERMEHWMVTIMIKESEFVDWMARVNEGIEQTLKNSL